MSFEVIPKKAHEIQSAERLPSTPNHVVYGIYELKVDMTGRSLAELRRACRGPLGLRDRAVASIDGRPVVDDGYRLRPGQRIEFMAPVPDA